MYFFKSKEKNFVCIGLITVILACVISITTVMRVDAANFKHKHGSSCYSQGTVACGAEHKQTTRPESTAAHCSNCGTQTAHTTTVRWEICQGNGESYELGGYRNCSVCGSKTYEWNNSAWKHVTTGQILTCTKGTAVTGNLWITNNTLDWTSGSVILEAGVKILSNELSMAKEPFSWDDKATWTTENQREVTENGTYTVYAKSSGGTVIGETISVTNIDRTGPRLSDADKSISEWTNQDVLLTFHGEDVQPEGSVGCGLAEAAYSFDGGVTYSDNNTLTVSQNGIYEVFMRDRLGNVGSGKVEVKNIDKNAPVINGINILNEEWQPASVTVQIEATDSEGESGLHKEAYSLDGGANWQSTPELTIVENGDYVIWVRDAVGNIATKDFSVGKIDVTAPVIEKMQVAQNKIYENKVFVTIFARDIQPDGTDGAGLHNEAYSFDGGETWQSENTIWIEKGQSYDIRVRDALEWESGENIVTRKNFPYPQPQEESGDKSDNTNKPVVTPGNPEIEDTPQDKGENESAKQHDKEVTDKKEKPSNVQTIQGNPDGMYDYGKWYEHRIGTLDKAEDEEQNSQEVVSKTVLLETQMKNKDSQVHVVKIPWYTTPVGKTVIGSAVVLAAGLVLGGLFWLFMFSVPVYCVEEKNRLYHLGRVLLHRTKEGYSVYLSDLMLRTAAVPKYRIKVSRILLKKAENERLLVESEEKNLEVLMQETIDFEL